MGFGLIRLFLNFGQKNHFSIDTELQEENYYLTSCFQIFLFTLMLCPTLPLPEIYKIDCFRYYTGSQTPSIHIQEESLIKEVIRDIYTSNCRIQTMISTTLHTLSILHNSL